MTDARNNGWPVSHRPVDSAAVVPKNRTHLLLLLVVAAAGVGGGIYLATESGGSGPDESAASPKTLGGSASGVGVGTDQTGGDVATVPVARVFPRRDREVAHRAGPWAQVATGRPFNIVGKGLGERKIAACPALKAGRNKPFVYGVGSSTMGGLAKVLGKELETYGVRSRKWARAGSGLARPDFHDWPAVVPNIVRDHDPDVFVVVLGTNDNQAVWAGKEWFRPNHPKWKPVYASRIEAMLKAMNKGRQRWVFWVGPNVLDRKSSRQVGKRINALMKKHVQGWKGPAWYVDLYTTGSDAKGRPKKLLARPDGGFYKPRGHDGIHLTFSGLRWALAEPVLKRLRPCIAGKGQPGLATGPRPRRPAATVARQGRRLL